LTKNIELMSYGSNEFETFRSKNNVEIRHIVYFFTTFSWYLRTYLLFGFTPHHTICVRLSPTWVLIDGLLLFGCVSEMVSWKYLIGLLWFH
jgi:hypothetical protein